MSGFCIAIVGFVAQLAIPKPRFPGLSYGFLFPVAMGLYCPFISIVCWIGELPPLPLLPLPYSLKLPNRANSHAANNTAPSSKRAVGMALLISLGNLGGIVGSNIYLAAEEPKYPAGFGVCLAMACSAVIMAFFLRHVYDSENKRRKRLIEEQGEELTRRYTEQEMLDLGDKNPFFVYTL